MTHTFNSFHVDLTRYIQAIHESPLVAQMPNDQKLQFLQLQLEKQNKSIVGAQNDREILTSENKKLRIQLVKYDILYSINTHSIIISQQVT